MSEPKGAGPAWTEERRRSDEGRQGLKGRPEASGRASERQSMTDLERYQDPLTIQRVLHTARTIAIVGLSKNELRASYFVGYYLKRHGYRVIPVNPRETEILGEKCYASLLDIPEPVDVVNVFRAPDALPGIAREAVDIHAGALWCQFGVINADGARIAEDGGVTVIMDRCLKVEHARYVGRMHWLGFNTQRITSVRAGLQ
jgi:predicted CoA-binding protein